MKRKVLLIFPQGDLQTGVYFRRAFENLKTEVTVLDPNVESKETLLEKLGTLPDKSFDLAFLSRSAVLSDKVVMEKLRDLAVSVACFNTDTRYDIGHWKYLYTLFQYCDVCYTVDYDTVKDFKEIGMHNFKWMPEGVDLALMSPDFVKPLSADEIQKYWTEVMFAGEADAIHEDRAKLLETVSENFMLKRYAYSTSNYLLNDNHTRAALCSGVILCHHAWQNRRRYVSARLVRSLITGVPVVSQDVRDAEYILPADLYYGFSPEDHYAASTAIEEVLTCRDDFIPRAQRAKSFVERNLTFTRICQFILNQTLEGSTEEFYVEA